MRRLTTSVTLLATSALVMAGCGGGGATQDAKGDSNSSCTQSGTTGITDTTIKIGQTGAASGSLAVLGSYRVGLKAWVDKTNAAGGLEGPDGKTRKVELVSLDDGYDPSRARSNTDTLINKDKVFAMVSSIGTPTALAARPVTEKACAPNLFVLSGTPALSDPDHPSMINMAVISTSEGKIFAEFLKKTKPNAKVAILAQNGDYSVPYLKGFKDGIKGSDITIADEQTYEATDTDVSKQITTLAATKADTLLTVAVTTQALQAINNANAIDWKPDILLPNGTALTPAQLELVNKGGADKAILASYFKDPHAAEWKDDPAMNEFKKWWDAAPNSSKYEQTTGLSGWLAGELFAETFKSAAKADRASVIDSVHKLTYDTAQSIVLPGIKIQTNGSSDPYLIEGERLAKFDPASKTMKPLETLDLNGQK